MRELRLTVRTPRGIVIEEKLRSVRIPTDTGQVGLRPGQEPMTLVVEPGLIVLRSGDATQMVATAGGLFSLEEGRATLYTPFAEAGRSENELRQALERALAIPDGELGDRRRLAVLEQRIIQELRPSQAVRRAELVRGMGGHDERGP
jgi:F0F1-type ATP synthase epsilon subunit